MYVDDFCFGKNPRLFLEERQRCAYLVTLNRAIAVPKEGKKFKTNLDTLKELRRQNE
jgi:hypothetical protein